jgi:hypothetical protein
MNWKNAKGSGCGPFLKFCLSICLEGLREATEKVKIVFKLRLKLGSFQI